MGKTGMASRRRINVFECVLNNSVQCNTCVLWSGMCRPTMLMLAKCLCMAC